MKIRQGHELVNKYFSFITWVWKHQSDTRGHCPLLGTCHPWIHVRAQITPHVSLQHMACGRCRTLRCLFSVFLGDDDQRHLHWPLLRELFTPQPTWPLRHRPIFPLVRAKKPNSLSLFLFSLGRLLRVSHVLCWWWEYFLCVLWGTDIKGSSYIDAAEG